MDVESLVGLGFRNTFLAFIWKNIPIGQCELTGKKKFKIYKLDDSQKECIFYHTFGDRKNIM